jgi:hypothetical protein
MISQELRRILRPEMMQGARRVIPEIAVSPWMVATYSGQDVYTAE